MRKKHDRQYHKKALKQAILDATLTIIEKEGYQAVTIRKIAAAIDYSIPTIYEFFENKETLFRELKKEWLQNMLNALQKIKEEKLKPLGTLKKVAFAYTKYALENPSHYRAVMETKTRCEDFSQIQQLRTLLKELIPYATDNRVDLFRSFLHGVVSLALTQKIAGEESRYYELVNEGISAFLK
ncbi:MAG TPA: TetR/AcrR family transcriptional regulator [Rhabdochlamydiaceae bacterium]|nr:TetR/AcrR family transcriptional regulator [Rhabdochlamydiaceae bacterium]